MGNFFRKLHLFDVNVDTIPSVSGEYKPLQVVHGGKNKYLLSRLFFADFGFRKSEFRCGIAADKMQGDQLLLWSLSRGKSSPDAPCRRVASARARHCQNRFHLSFSAPLDFTVRAGRPCFVGELFSE